MKRTKKLITFILIAVVLCMVLLSGCSGGRKNINLDKYVGVTFSGYNGAGTATVTLDTYRISEDYDGKVKVKDPAYEELSIGEIIGDAVQIRVIPNSGLQGGEKVKLDWNVDESYIKEVLGCRVSYSDMEYTVWDLVYF